MDHNLSGATLPLAVLGLCISSLSLSSNLLASIDFPRIFFSMVEIGCIIFIFRTDRKFMGSLRYFTSSYLAGMSLHKEHKFDKVGLEKRRPEELIEIMAFEGLNTH